MKTKVLIILSIIFILTGCEQKEVVSIIENDKSMVSINYPVTDSNVLNDAISSYVNKVYNEFKAEENKYKKPELNISYTYKEVNENVISVSLNTEIYTDKTVNKIKTFNYDQKNDKFLTMEDIVRDLEALDYDIKKALLEKYQEADMDFLSNVTYDYFTIDNENLTLYFNPVELDTKKNETIYLDIPLNSLRLLIDIDKETDDNTYISIKKKNIDYDKKVVALTFDDGPSKYTEKILDILKKYDACATFFVVGNKVEFYSDQLKRMLKEGSEIGNHSYSHKWLNRLTKEEFQEEINKTQKAIKKETGFTPKLFRPTYGGYSDKLKTYTDLTFVLWTVDSSDWKVKNTEKILNNILPNIQDGSIILMHDNHSYAVKALDDVIKKLKEEGYQFVTVSELLEIKNLREN